MTAVFPATKAATHQMRDPADVSIGRESKRDNSSETCIV
jgi:hypothetical protein